MNDHLRKAVECRKHAVVLVIGIYLLATLAQALPISELADHVAKKNPHVLLLGERHDDWKLQIQYSILLEQLIQRGWNPDCITIELPRNFQSELNFLGKKQPEQILIDLTLRYAASYTAGGYANVKASLNTGLTAWISFLHQSTLLGIPAFAIDTDSSVLHRQDIAGFSVSAEGMKFRNQEMAQKLNELFSDKTCSKIFSVHGADHLFRSSKIETARPIQKYLDRNIKWIAADLINMTDVNPKNVQSGG